jgi:hypothetical protein
MSTPALPARCGTPTRRAADSARGSSAAALTLRSTAQPFLVKGSASWRTPDVYCTGYMTVATADETVSPPALLSSSRSRYLGAAMFSSMSPCRGQWTVSHELTTTNTKFPQSSARQNREGQKAPLPTYDAMEVPPAPFPRRVKPRCAEPCRGAASRRPSPGSHATLRASAFVPLPSVLTFPVPPGAPDVRRSSSPRGQFPRSWGAHRDSSPSRSLGRRPSRTTSTSERNMRQPLPSSSPPVLVRLRPLTFCLAQAERL